MASYTKEIAFVLEAFVLGVLGNEETVREAFQTDCVVLGNCTRTGIRRNWKSTDGKTQIRLILSLDAKHREGNLVLSATATDKLSFAEARLGDNLKDFVTTACHAMDSLASLPVDSSDAVVAAFLWRIGTLIPSFQPGLVLASTN